MSTIRKPRFEYTTTPQKPIPYRRRKSQKARLQESPDNIKSTAGTNGSERLADNRAIQHIRFVSGSPEMVVCPQTNTAYISGHGPKLEGSPDIESKGDWVDWNGTNK